MEEFVPIVPIETIVVAIVSFTIAIIWFLIKFRKNIFVITREDIDRENHIKIHSFTFKRFIKLKDLSGNITYHMLNDGDLVIKQSSNSFYSRVNIIDKFGDILHILKVRN